jgi:Predicted dehydrogenases and related proteins
MHDDGEKEYTAAIIGCGRIGYSLGLDKKREQPASHTMALRENPRVSLIAGCDTDETVLSQWHAVNRHAIVYNDSANLYARQKPDILVVAVNEVSHLKEALAAINSEPKLVILEKPVALNMTDALTIQEASVKHSVPVMVNHERRFGLDYILAKKYFSQIGSVQSITANLFSSLRVYSPKEESSGAYSLLHDGTHLVDIVLYFLEEAGKPSSLLAVPRLAHGGGLLNHAVQMKIPEEHFVNALLNRPIITGLFRDENGDVRNVSAHYAVEKCPEVTISMSGRSRYFGFDVDIRGTEGRICIGNGYLKLYRRAESHLYTGFYSLTRDSLIKLPKSTCSFTNMVQNAIDFLDGAQPLKSTLQNGINALAVLEEIKDRIKY